MSCQQPQAHPARCGCDPEVPVGYVSGERFNAEHERLRERRKERDRLRAELAALKGEQVAVAWAICREPGKVDELSATYANRRAAAAHIDSYGNEPGLFMTDLYTHPCPQQPGPDVAGLVEALEKISAYAPCSGVKDPGFTKMHMGILARDALATHDKQAVQEVTWLAGRVCGGDADHNTVNVKLDHPAPWSDLRIGTTVLLAAHEKQSGEVKP